MKKLAAIAIVTSAFFMTGESTEGQIFRRFRENVRGAITDSRPQYAPRQYQQTPQQQLPQQRFVPQSNIQQRQVQPQRQVQQRVTNPNQVQRNASPQQMTPYAQLTPAQRAAVPVTSGNTPKITAPKPIAAGSPMPANVNANGTKIRIVTYMDPRTGRTFQRRYLVPSNTPAPPNVPNQAVAAGQPNVNQRINAGLVPVPNVPQTASAIPPLNLTPAAGQSVVNNSANEPQLMPVLSGPTLEPPTLETAIPASLEDSSQVETASAEMPDLSGIAIETQSSETSTEPTLEGQDDFFSDTDLSEVDLDEVDEANDAESYSVLESFDE